MSQPLLTHPQLSPTTLPLINSLLQLLPLPLPSSNPSPLPYPPPSLSTILSHLLTSLHHLQSSLSLQSQTRVSLQSQLKRLHDYPARSQTLTKIDILIQQQFQLLNLDIEFGTELLSRIMEIIEREILVFVKEIDDVKNNQSVLLLDVDALTERVRELESQKQQRQVLYNKKLQEELSKQQLQTTSSLTTELRLSKQKTAQLQKSLQSLTKQLSLSPSERIESLSNELLINKKKVEDMMKMVAKYQNETLDHQLVNERLGFELSTMKGQLEEMRSPRGKREKGMTESMCSGGGGGRLESSSRFEGRGGGGGMGGERWEKWEKWEKEGVRQVEEVEMPLLESSMSRKVKQRIFNEESRVRKEGGVGGESPGPKLTNQKSSI